MTPVIFINCKEYPFIDQIISGRKWYETRTKDTLSRFAGQRVYLAETGKGHPVVKCSAVLHSPIKVVTAKEWEFLYRNLSAIPNGCKYDWQPITTAKYCYYIDSIRPIQPAFVPEGKRHGRVWMEWEGGDR